MNTVQMQAEADLTDGALGPHRAGVLLLAMAAVFAAMVALATLLPHDPYIRYQQLRQTIQFRSQWVYERIAMDPTPIDIAIVGNSRANAGVSAPALQAALRQRTGGDVHVANLSLPQEGRNLHYVVAKRLMETRPEVKTLVLSVIEEMPRIGHPAFRDLADAQDVIGAPILLNFGYANDVAVLPYRQMSLFAQTLNPELFGVSRTLSPDYAGPALDTTETYRLPDGRIVDRDAIVPEDELRAAAEAMIRGGRGRMLPASLADYEYAIERTYTRKIADLAKRHGVTVIFLKLPIYGDTRIVRETGFYNSLGTILAPSFLAPDSTYYADYGHLNRRGSARTSAWLAEQLVLLNAVGEPGKPHR